VDPLTRTPFAYADPAELQDLVRLHDGTCTFAPALHAKVAREHKAGIPATMPADRSSLMTLEDFSALRNTMRRRDPGYKIPGRRHQPPPPEWQLYIASDQRSGRGFAYVMYVDVTKARRTMFGIDYPLESIRADLGFIPLDLDQSQLLISLIRRAAAANKLLTPVAGGWKPIAGFPYSKQHWMKDRDFRLNNLCRSLAKSLDLGF
jgi:hypothetical protein